MASQATLRSVGPYKGVQNTLDPYGASKEFLQDALNCYIPDTINGQGLYARPGFSLNNLGDQLSGVAQGVYAHTSLSGVTYNFIVSGGLLYRVDAALTTFEDVTPVSGVTIDPDVRRVYFTSFGDYLIVTDGVNAPWLASDLGDPNVTGVYIDFDGMGTPWSAFGRPTIYAGSAIFIINEIDGVGAQTDLTWSSPGNPAQGYQQAGFDYRWTLEQTGSAPIYGIWGTNVSLFYWRATSIGSLAGTPNIDFQTTSTHDAIAGNVGLTQSATIAQYLNTIFFCDAIGRPWMMNIGSPPVPIWLNMSQVVNSATSAYPDNTQKIAVACIEPNLNLYVAAIWSPVPGTDNAPVECQVFDAKTGAYLGRWRITVGSVAGTSIQAMGILSNIAASGRLVIVGSSDSPPTNMGYVWVLSAVEGGEGLSFLTTESGIILTTESGMALTTEDVLVTWKDNDQVPDISATTPRLGYSDDQVVNVDTATVITGSSSPVEVIMTTPNTLANVQGIPTPSNSEDLTYRLVVGANVQGRGVAVTVIPTEAEEQWILLSVGAKGVFSKADRSDP